MPEFTLSDTSVNKLQHCDERLRRIACAAIKRTPVDFTIVHTFRGEATQNRLFEKGASKLKYPHSKHNAMLNDKPNSLAIDFAPIVHKAIPWKDTHIFAVIAGVFMACAAGEQCKLRWGGDWDMDGSTTDQNFMDWGHIELVE